MSEFVFIPLFAAAVIALLLIIYNNILTVKHFTIDTDKLKKPLRIVLVSDLHNRRWGKDNARLLTLIARQKPDAVFVTGDIVDRHRPDFELASSFLSKLSKLAPTFAVTGNHERALGYDTVIERLDVRKLIIDEKYKIFDDFSVLGLSDTVGIDHQLPQDDLVRIFSRLSNFKIVAVHRPTQFADGVCLREHDIDLVLCGHTHGGVVRMPFFGAVFSPDEGFFPKYSRGLYKENGTVMVVSSGVGNTLLPLRLNNFPQIVTIDVLPAKK